MGGYVSREWSEVVSGGSPGSPGTAGPTEEGSAPGRSRILARDPRSVSEEVNRTPIQVERTPNDEDAAPEVRDTPLGGAVNKRFKALSLDPRSPSGLPRTPILVEEESRRCKREGSGEAAGKSETPKAAPGRGATSERSVEMVAPVSRLVFPDQEEEVEVDEEQENRKMAEELSVPVTPPKSASKTLTALTGSSLEADCRSPLLIENDAYDKGLFTATAPSLGYLGPNNKKRGPRTPLGSVDANLPPAEASPLSRKSIAVSDNSNDSLVI